MIMDVRRGEYMLIAIFIFGYLILYGVFFQPVQYKVNLSLINITRYIQYKKTELLNFFDKDQAKSIASSAIKTSVFSDIECE